MILIFISNGGWCLAPPALSLDPLSRLHGEPGGDTPGMVVLTDDQHPVEELPAQGTDDPLTDRVAPHRQLHPIRMIGTVASG